jgi:hypothetical protein
MDLPHATFRSVLGDEGVDDLGGAPESVKRVTDFVCDPGDDLPQGAEPARPHELILEACAFIQGGAKLCPAAPLRVGQQSGHTPHQVVKYDLERLFEGWRGV